jgi:phage protein D
MDFEDLHIEIDGEEASDLYPDLIQLEVELDDELAAMFRLRLALPQLPDGSWGKLDDPRLSLWKPVTINAGFESGAEELIAGYITHLHPDFVADPAGCTLEVWGLDGSVLMDREQKLKAWTNKKDSDIASEILTSYGFGATVEDTQVVHEEAVSTIVQRETDMQFLRRLALRNGYECYVEGTTGYFRPPQIDASPQPLLAAQFGDETTLMSFRAEVNALAPANVAMAQIDRLTKELLDASAETSDATALGATDAQGVLGAGVDPAKVVVAMSVATGAAEMTALCQGLYDRGQWFVTAHGTVAANLYGHVLRPRATVTIKGVGEAHSGIYYVTHVTHAFGPEGYVQSFSAKRNALQPSGAEEFTAGGGLF